MFPNDKAQQRRITVSLICILLITFIVFFPILFNDFTNWDDNKYITQNQAIKDFSLSGIKRLFTTFRTPNQYYNPLTLLTFAVEYKLVGLDATLYIINNLTLHLANVLLVFFFIYSLSQRPKTALLCALLFGIHPMHVESVAWIVERKDVLYTFFYLLALTAFCYHVRYHMTTMKYLILTFGFFVLSLLSKASAISLPLALLLINYYMDGKVTVKNVAEKIPFFLLSLAFGLIGVFNRLEGLTPVYSVYERFVIACHALMTYVYKLILPVSLSPYYPYPEKIAGYLPKIYYVNTVAALAFIVLILMSARKNKTVFFGGMFFLATIAHTLGLVPIGGTVIAERYSYVPYIGLFFLIATRVNILTDPRSGGSRVFKFVLRFLVLFYVIVFALLSFQRAQVWRNGVTLWSDVIEKYPRLALSYSNRGNAYSLQGKYGRALADYNTALMLEPDHYAAYSNRGYMHMLRGDHKKALRDFSRALYINPFYIRGYLNRAEAHETLGQFKKAIDDYTQILQINPRFYSAFLERAKLRIRAGELEEAVYDLNKYLDIMSKDPAAYLIRSRVYLEMGQENLALSDALRARHFGGKVDEAYIRKLQSLHLK